jgi:hypothetical protein
VGYCTTFGNIEEAGQIKYNNMQISVKALEPMSFKAFYHKNLQIPCKYSI